MKIPKLIQEVNEFFMPTQDKQGNINVFHLWNHLVQRYNIIFLTSTFEQFTKDEDLKLILSVGKKSLSEHITLLEKEMMSYGIPLPLRPPKQTQSTASLEQINDRIYL